MWRDGWPVAVNRALIPSFFLQHSLFALTAKLEVGEVLEAIKPKFIEERRADAVCDFRQSFPSASFVRQNHAEIKGRLSRPVVPDIQTDADHVRGQVASDAVDLFLRRHSSDHCSTCLQDTLLGTTATPER